MPARYPNTSTLAVNAVQLVIAFSTATLVAQNTGVTSSSRGQNRTDIVMTVDGPVKGIIKQNVRQFLGIPYAAPPVGDLRWRPPQTRTPWRGPRDTVAFGPTCAQNVTLFGFAATSEREDCLYLNVFTPNKEVPASRWRVMVWIYGGGQYDGA